jgi:hypothetical protein
MAQFYGIDLHPMWIDGLHGIAAWRDVPVDKLLVEAAQKFPLDIPRGVRIMIKEFYGERHNIGSRQVQRANQRRVADIGDAETVRLSELAARVRRPRRV